MKEIKKVKCVLFLLSSLAFHKIRYSEEYIRWVPAVFNGKMIYIYAHEQRASVLASRCDPLYGAQV